MLPGNSTGPRRSKSPAACWRLVERPNARDELAHADRTLRRHRARGNSAHRAHDQSIGDGRPGIRTLRLLQHFHEYVAHGPILPFIIFDRSTKSRAVVRTRYAAAACCSCLMVRFAVAGSTCGAGRPEPTPTPTQAPAAVDAAAPTATATPRLGRADADAHRRNHHRRPSPPTLRPSPGCR